MEINFDPCQDSAIAILEVKGVCGFILHILGCRFDCTARRVCAMKQDMR